MYVSVTERQTFMRCRRKWDYGSNNRQGLVRLGASAPPLELGSLIHKTLAKWLIDPKLESSELYEGKLSEVFRLFAAERLDVLQKQYKEVIGAEISDEELAPLLDSVDLGEAMMHNYQQYYKRPLSENMKFASAEQEVQVPIPGATSSCPDCINTWCQWCAGKGVLDGGIPCTDCGRRFECKTCDSTGRIQHYLRATFDGLIQDAQGNLYVLEHKTYGRRPRIESLHTNDQFTGYVWAANQLGIGRVIGVAYDGMWKRPSAPRRNSTEDLFLRTTIRKPDEELEEWGRNLVYQTLEMSNPNTPIYPNRRWEGCNDCGYQAVCTAQSRGEPVDELIRLTYTTRSATEAQPDGVDRTRGIRSFVASSEDSEEGEADE